MTSAAIWQSNFVASNRVILAIPHWPAYTASDRATLVLDRNCHVDNDYGREARLLWKEITGVV